MTASRDTFASLVSVRASTHCTLKALQLTPGERTNVSSGEEVGLFAVGFALAFLDGIPAGVAEASL